MQYKDVAVLPTISADGYVQLRVTQEVNNATAETGPQNAPVISTRSVQTALLVRDGQSGTGKLAFTENDIVRDEYRYDQAGNTVFTTRPQGNARRDRASYYAADGTLRAADYRTATIGVDNALYQFTFEEYRYDALGRRVWVRARRICKTASASDCDISTVRRTVWDGSQELYEIQMPDDDTYRENDTQILPDLGLNLSGMDRNAFFGRVAYAYGLGVDQPLSITRIRYADRVSGSHWRWEPFSMMPQWNLRGKMDNGTFANGEQKLCTDAAQPRCVRVASPWGWFAYDRPNFLFNFWHGTLLEDKQDRAGTAYRRNRQYDPYSGRFTQEDPIGLAGGLSAYGFANGDPVSNGDPSGLACEKKGEERMTCTHVQAGDFRAVSDFLGGVAGSNAYSTFETAGLTRWSSDSCRGGFSSAQCTEIAQAQSWLVNSSDRQCSALGTSATRRFQGGHYRYSPAETRWVGLSIPVLSRNVWLAGTAFTPSGELPNTIAHEEGHHRYWVKFTVQLNGLRHNAGHDFIYRIGEKCAMGYPY